MLVPKRKLVSRERKTPSAGTTFLDKNNKMILLRKCVTIYIDVSLTLYFIINIAWS